MNEGQVLMGVIPASYASLESIESAIKEALTKNYDVIIVSSDRDEVLGLAYKYFCTDKVQPHRRPEKMRDAEYKHIVRQLMSCYGGYHKFSLLIPDNLDFKEYDTAEFIENYQDPPFPLSNHETVL